MPLYVKSHSYGEYIFDWEWARAYAQHGLEYYPKLLAATPFTPATGGKILCHAQAEPAVVGLLLDAAQQLSETLGCHSIHALFLPLSTLPDFSRAGFISRYSFQFHWINQGYRDFEQFLARFKSRKRKQIRAERRQAHHPEICIHRLRGADIKAEHALAMTQFYQDTTHRKQAMAYLAPGFFQIVFERMADRVLLVMAQVNGQWVAGACYFTKGNALFGRYWGCQEAYRFLHFELCYYQGIEYAIQQGMHLFEAGAQGTHKFSRGFLPELTYSGHQMANASFHEAVRHFVVMEKQAIEETLAEFEQALPFRRDAESP